MNLSEIERACLEQVTTINEACAKYKKNYKTIYNLCASGSLISRRAGATWLISVTSLEKRWGTK